jgi:hypothetical protein
MANRANRKVVDLLDVDTHIRGDQMFGVYSFVEPPNDVFETKEIFMFGYYFKKQMLRMIKESTKPNGYINLDMDRVLEDYKEFKSINNEFLSRKFIEEYGENFGTTRMFKFRGAWPSPEKANEKALELVRANNMHGAIMLESGKWVPFNPRKDKIEKKLYTDDRLNDLMKYHINAKANARKYAEERRQVLAAKMLEEEPKSERAKTIAEESKFTKDELELKYTKYSNQGMMDKVIEQRPNEVAKEIEELESQIAEIDGKNAFKVSEQYMKVKGVDGLQSGIPEEAREFSERKNIVAESAGGGLNIAGLRSDEGEVRQVTDEEKRFTMHSMEGIPPHLMMDLHMESMNHKQKRKLKYQEGHLLN